MKRKYENFGRLMRAIREDQKLTQAEFARLAGASSQTVSNCERGTAALPKPKVKRLIKSLHISRKKRATLVDAIAQDAFSNKQCEWLDIK